MLSGDPGTGKTFLAGQIAQEVCDEYNAIAIMVDKVSDYSGLIDSIRQADPLRTIVIIIDEFEKSFKSWETEPLSFLDGSKSRDNVMVIATVNDHGLLPGYITDRPSRFEKVFEFDFGDKVVLSNIISSLIPEEWKANIDVKTLTSDLLEQENKSIDKIKHIIRDVIANKIEQKSTGVNKPIVIDSKNDADKHKKKSKIGFKKEPIKLLSLDDLIRCELECTENETKEIILS